MEASYPSLRPRTSDDYDRDLDTRVREPDMDTALAYSFICRIALSRHGGVFEFPAQISTITHLEPKLGLARASLSLLILDNNKSPLIALDTETEDGIVTPTNRRRIANAELGHIGIITRGYFVSPSLAPALNHETTPRLVLPTA